MSDERTTARVGSSVLSSSRARTARNFRNSTKRRISTSSSRCSFPETTSNVKLALGRCLLVFRYSQSSKRSPKFDKIVEQLLHLHSVILIPSPISSMIPRHQMRLTLPADLHRISSNSNTRDSVLARSRTVFHIVRSRTVFRCGHIVRGDRSRGQSRRDWRVTK